MVITDYFNQHFNREFRYLRYEDVMGLKGVKMKCIHWSKESRDIMYIFGASVHLPCGKFSWSSSHFSKEWSHLWWNLEKKLHLSNENCYSNYQVQILFIYVCRLFLSLIQNYPPLKTVCLFYTRCACSTIFGNSISQQRLK